jgi:hypothetical protein
MNSENDPTPPAEARVVPNGEPIESGMDIFEGTLDAARIFIAALSPAERAEVSIWTPGHTFTVDELMAERPGHEHEPDGQAS